jgi:hypothetical protein
MTFYVCKEVETELSAEVDDDEIIEYIMESEERIAHYREAIGVDASLAATELADLPSLDRDQFIQALREEFRVRGFAWPT